MLLKQDGELDGFIEYCNRWTPEAEMSEVRWTNTDAGMMLDAFFKEGGRHAEREIAWAGDVGTVMGTTIDGVIGVAADVPAGWAADSPRVPPGGDWRVVCACSTAGSSRHAAAVTVNTGRREGFFIGVLSRGTPGTDTLPVMLGMLAHGLEGGQWLIGTSAQ